jgi:hypothetical protein
VLDPCCWQEAKNAIAMTALNKTNICLKLIFIGYFWDRMPYNVKSYSANRLLPRFVSQSASLRRVQRDLEKPEVNKVAKGKMYPRECMKLSEG